MENPEFVTVTADGQSWSAFKRVVVRASFKDAARSFELTIAAEASPKEAAWTFSAGTEVEIVANGDLVCRGYVDRYQPKINEHREAIIEVCGRSKAQDFIDSSAVHDTGHFKDKDPQQIATELDKFGVGIRTNRKLKKVPVYRLTPGESCFAAIEHLCRKQGVWQVGQPDGSILITTAGDGRHTPLVEGKNILTNFMTGSADHNWSGRHSDVIVRGQRPVGHGKGSLEVEAKARDRKVKRYRPVVVVQDDDTDHATAKKRASHRRDAEAGNSLKACVTVQGWRDAGGKLWTPGFLTFMQSDFLDVAQDMALESVSFSQERGAGSGATLSLTDPAALGGKGRKGGAANEAWGTDAGADEE